MASTSTSPTSAAAAAAAGAAAGAAAAAAASHALARFGLRGKRALVTGGTKGIGRAVVEELALLGAEVFTCSRTARELEAALAEWRSRGLLVEGAAADVSTPEGREGLLRAYADSFEGEARLDILINNVGTNVKKPSAEYTKGDYDRVFGTNLESVVALTALAHPLLKRGAEASRREKKAGGERAATAAVGAAPEASAVVLVSSVAGGPPSMRSGSLYAATKAALDQLARNWACEWARDGIRVTAVRPFYIDTPLAAGVVGDPAQLAQVLAATPSRRVGSPQDVAGVVAFLCSRASAHVTGETVAVDGGYLAAGFWPE